jgi:hypothetical protein
MFDGMADSGLEAFPREEKRSAGTPYADFRGVLDGNERPYSNCFCPPKTCVVGGRQDMTAKNYAVN